ncbi:glycosyltransferase [Leuconostoc suionicum]|uniref:glycosyltransferase n=1 Tax=Leuconostoc suionicum TaxID=1511761 RepID=UPI00233F3B7D|nr:glycosyltransferase [Leuconostoc suionicum]MDC2816368.1 glycosyltransferase [Leuconostoc suionicum]
MFVFVILHYQSFDETAAETMHIINDLSGKNRVVIVDNASPNGSGKKLEELFLNNKNVDVILSNNNTGYAKGNNLGIRYALEKYSPDFIILANNDIEFKQNNFSELLQESFQKKNFDILGPDIFVPETGIHQNPKQSNSYTIEQVQKINNNSRRLLNQNNLLFSFRANLKRVSRLRKFVIQKRKATSIKTDTIQLNVVLHGSLLVFSKQFFDKMMTPFDEKTFFYFETEILDRKMKELNMIAKYDPSMLVYHHQNTSTRQSFKNAKAQQEFQLINMIKSTQRFIDLFK